MNKARPYIVCKGDDSMKTLLFFDDMHLNQAVNLHRQIGAPKLLQTLSFSDDDSHIVWNYPRIIAAIIAHFLEADDVKLMLLHVCSTIGAKSQKILLTDPLFYLVFWGFHSPKTIFMIITISKTTAIPIQKPILIPKKDVVPNRFIQIVVQFIGSTSND